MLVPGCIEAGCAAFTGDGAGDNFFLDPLKAVKAAGGVAVPTIKPWAKEDIFHKMDLAVEAGAMAIAMDIDSAGLPLLAAAGKPVNAKSAAELSEIAAYVPSLYKGIITVEAARAAASGAYRIVVSNTARVLDTPPRHFRSS